MSLTVYVKNQTRREVLHVESFIKELGSHMIPSLEEGEVSVLFCGDKLMKRLNEFYRGKPKTTDVLSFCAEMPGVLGDIVISIPQATKQAKESLKEEIGTLLCHGFLHLLGYDHELGEKEYKEMLSLQNHLLKIQHTELQVL